MKNRYCITFQKEVKVGDIIIKSEPIFISTEIGEATLIAMKQKYSGNEVDKAIVEKMCDILKNSL
jgi:hypothetical protein